VNAPGYAISGHDIEGWGHGPTGMVVLSTTEHEELVAIAADRNRPHKQVRRVRIVLASADRHPVQRLAQSIGVSWPMVWRRQQRFAESVVEG
jgi:hypothetical protein